ncbi:MAG: hypothetical protein LUG91_01730 [Ruminococcus sp.]|nr:hypothetical protein [Ruminococcus sp.]
MSKKNETQAYIEAAVTAAVEACMQGIDEKMQEAVNLGVTIGAATGAEIGASAAVKAVERERKKFRNTQRDKRFHNTKLLLRHYRALNEHYKNAVFDVKTAEGSSEDFADIMQAMNSTMSDEELYIESIKQSCIRTKVIMAHVNKMLDIYRIMCEQSNRMEDKRHWRILSALYLMENGASAAEMAEREHIDKRTVYKDIDVCIDDLTTLFFGIGGIEGK